MYAFNRRRDLDIISESYKIQEFDLTTWIPDPSPMSRYGQTSYLTVLVNLF